MSGIAVPHAGSPGRPRQGQTNPQDAIDPHFGFLRETGFEVRPARFDDLPRLVEMFNAAEIELTGTGGITAERYTQEWKYPGFNLDEDTRAVFSPDGSPVGCAEVWTLLDPPVHPWMWTRVHPEWRGHGIGTALLAWSLARALRVIDRAPSDARFAPRVACPSTHEPSVALFRDFGFEPTRRNWTMTIDLDVPPPTPVWPEGLHLRPYRHPQDLRAVYAAVVDSFRDHWGFVEAPFEDGLRQFTHASAELRPLDPSLWLVAVDGDEIAGVALCRRQTDEDPDMGWVDTLGVLRPWRKRGLGLALLLHAFTILHAAGAGRAGLGVDSANLTGATRLYTRAGMRVLRESTSFELEVRPGKELARLE
jgi:GNAT superfamily N-acetyltransferase